MFNPSFCLHSFASHRYLSTSPNKNTSCIVHVQPTGGVRFLFSLFLVMQLSIFFSLRQTDRYFFLFSLTSLLNRNTSCFQVTCQTDRETTTAHFFPRMVLRPYKEIKMYWRPTHTNTQTPRHWADLSLHLRTSTSLTGSVAQWLSGSARFSSRVTGCWIREKEFLCVRVCEFACVPWAPINSLCVCVCVYTSVYFTDWFLLMSNAERNKVTWVVA